MKGLGRIYQQSFVDTYCKVAFAKLYSTKTLITPADLLNDRVRALCARSCSDCYVLFLEMYLTFSNPSK